MTSNYCFRLQRVRLGAVRRFQLRIGMPGEGPLEFIPVHRSAFTQKLPLKESHEIESDAHLELTTLLGWLEKRDAHLKSLRPAGPIASACRAEI